MEKGRASPGDVVIWAQIGCNLYLVLRAGVTSIFPSLLPSPHSHPLHAPSATPVLCWAGWGHSPHRGDSSDHGPVPNTALLSGLCPTRRPATSRLRPRASFYSLSSAGRQQGPGRWTEASEQVPCPALAVPCAGLGLECWWPQMRLSVSPQGRFTIAAKHHISIAEIYETELVDIEKVCAHWRPCLGWRLGPGPH